MKLGNFSPRLIGIALIVAILALALAIPASAQEPAGNNATVEVVKLADGTIQLLADKSELYVQGDEVTNQTLNGTPKDGKWIYVIPVKTQKSVEVKFAVKLNFPDGTCKLSAGTTWFICVGKTTTSTTRHTGGNYVVNNPPHGGVNLRSGSGTNTAVLRWLTNGTPVNVTGFTADTNNNIDCSNWAHVDQPEPGFVCAAMLTPMGAPTTPTTNVACTGDNCWTKDASRNTLVSTHKTDGSTDYAQSGENLTLVRQGWATEFTTGFTWNLEWCRGTLFSWDTTNNKWTSQAAKNGCTKQKYEDEILANLTPGKYRVEGSTNGRPENENDGGFRVTPIAGTGWRAPKALAAVASTSGCTGTCWTIDSAKQVVTYSGSPDAKRIDTSDPVVQAALRAGYTAVFKMNIAGQLGTATEPFCVGRVIVDKAQVAERTNCASDPIPVAAGTVTVYPTDAGGQFYSAIYFNGGLVWVAVTN